MKKLLLFLYLFISVFAVAQPPAGTYTPVTTNGFSWLRGHFKSLHIPTANGTPALADRQWNGSGAILLDSVNHIVYYYSQANWRRIVSMLDTTSIIATKSDLAGVTVNAENGASFSSGNVILGGSSLDRYTAITLNGYPLSLRHDGVNNAAQSDSNMVRLFNTTASTSTTDSLVTPGLVFDFFGRRTVPSGASQNVRFRMFGVGTSTTSSYLTIQSNINNAGYTNIFRIQSSGNIPDGLTVQGRSIGTASSGTNNLRFGQQVMNSVTTGGSNTGIGDNSLQNLTTGSFNTAIGPSMAQNKIGDYNTSVGYLALATNDSSYNTAVGAQSLFSNTKGDQNTAIGVTSLRSNTTGRKNSAGGAGSMEENRTGNENSFWGHDAALHLSTGTGNSGIGWLSWSLDSNGNYNTGLGWSAGRSISNGSGNTFVGAQSGYLDTAGANHQKDSIDLCTVIGYGAYSTKSRQTVIGANYTVETKIFGKQLLPSYGSGAVTGTPTYYLAVDASGNVIETSASGASTLDDILANQSYNATITSAASISGSNNFQIGPFAGLNIQSISNINFSAAGDYVFSGNVFQFSTLPGSHNAADSMVVWNPSTEQIGIRPIPGNSITIGTTALSNSNSRSILYDSSGIIKTNPLFLFNTGGELQIGSVTDLGAYKLQISGDQIVTSTSNPKILVSNVASGGEAMALLAGTSGGVFSATSSGFFGIEMDALANFGGGSHMAMLTYGSTKNTLFGDMSAAQADISAQLGVLTSSSSKVAFKVRGASSQSANLSQWEDNSANILASISATGNFSAANILSGTYTPILTNVTNVTSSTPYACQYMRVGNTVTVSGMLEMEVSVGALNTELGISLPIASAIANNQEVSGVGASESNTEAYAIFGDPTNDRARIQSGPALSGNRVIHFSFTYQIL